MNLTLDEIKAFVLTVQKIVNKALIQPTEVIPESKTVEGGTFSVPSPSGGWIGVSELKNVNQKMVEAISAEKWEDGFWFAVQLIMLLGK